MSEVNRSVYGLEPEYYEVRVIQDAIKETAKAFDLRVETFYDSEVIESLGYATGTTYAVLSKYDIDGNSFYLNHHMSWNAIDSDGSNIPFLLCFEIRLSTDDKVGIVADFIYELQQNLRIKEVKLREYADMIQSQQNVKS